MKRVRVVLLLLCVILLLGIVLVGKEALREKENGEYDFSFTTYSYKNLDSQDVTTLDEEVAVVQPFIADGKRLDSVIFFIRYATLLDEKQGNICVDILDTEGNCVAGADLDCRGISSEGWFGWHHDFEVSLQQGELYYLRLTAEQLGDNSFELRVAASNGGIESRFPDLLCNDEPQENVVLLVSAGWTRSMTSIIPQKYEKELWGAVTILAYLLLFCGILTVILWCRNHGKRQMPVWLCSIAVILISLSGGAMVYRHNLPWYETTKLVAHALGEIDGVAYTNSKDAFEQSLEKGYRYLEADFSTTSDGHLVLRHDWGLEVPMGFEAGYVPTLAEFESHSICDSYSSLSVLDLLKLMDEYRDVYIITDSKEGDYDTVVENFQYLVETAQKNGYEDVLNRFIVQIYNDDMFHAVESVYSFEHYIYTLYQRGSEEIDQLIDFCRRNHIQVVTAFDFWWYERPEFKEKMQNSGLKIFIHTVNDVEAAKVLLEEGVTGIYTDSIVAEDL